MLRTPRKLSVGSIQASVAVAVSITAALAACALPQDRLTGIELSWSMLEREASDGDASLRLRTCAGALVRRVELTVEDVDDPLRASTLTYDCEFGYQTAEELASLTSNVFVDLRPGEYRLLTRALSDVDGDSYELEETLAVGERDLLKLDVDLSPPTAPWELLLAGAESCSVAAAHLTYAAPGDDLLLADGEVATTARYREALVGDQGLPLGGAEIACDGPWAVDQRFEVDPGRYVLNLEVDGPEGGTSCAVPIVIPFSGLTTTLDLANLPCDG